MICINFLNSPNKIILPERSESTEKSKKTRLFYPTINIVFYIVYKTYKRSAQSLMFRRE
jgi:hypothetical protein